MAETTLQNLHLELLHKQYIYLHEASELPVIGNDDIKQVFVDLKAESSNVDEKVQELINSFSIYLRDNNVNFFNDGRRFDLLLTAEEAKIKSEIVKESKSPNLGKVMEEIKEAVYNGKNSISFLKDKKPNTLVLTKLHDIGYKITLAERYTKISW